VKNLSGFRFNARKKVAHFEVIVPGTRGGKRRRKTEEARDVVDATTKYHAFRKEVSEAEKGPAVPHTLRWYFETYWPKMKAALSEKGRSFVEQAMSARVLPHLGEMLLERINDAEVGDFVAALREKKYAPETINGSLSTLRKFLRDAVAREVIDKYPIRRRLPRQKVESLRLELSPEERTAFLAVFDDEEKFRKALPQGHRFGKVVELADGTRRGGPDESLAAGYHFERFRELKPLFIIALETGLRHGDLLGLRWSSVNLRDGWVRVTMGKTMEVATIPLSKLCREAIEECRARLDAREAGKEDGVVVEIRRRDPEALVLVDGDGKPVPEARLERAFATAKKLAKITRRFRFHDLRHTFASTLASQGVSLQVIAKALGHTTTKMSERYARPSEEAIRKAADALDRANNSLAVNSSRELLARPGGKGAPEVGRKPLTSSGLYGEPCWTRTSDPLLKRQVL
jgi:integrase